MYKQISKASSLFDQCFFAKPVAKREILYSNNKDLKWFDKKFKFYNVFIKTKLKGLVCLKHDEINVLCFLAQISILS
ncbi:hypothetical protein GM418_10170 [Maribellus comscasis]|uniref:Uncharacterized protein n=1 Tax=Maribellus comscasis TaxID=2681766 RepID=A0A6I6JSF4_9BACT|nr:hypothetical protein [Maribellus comscasis]QGY44008.1 hypothetical protein GM418_10170 [Maribellus comscasis]